MTLRSTAALLLALAAAPALADDAADCRNRDYPDGMRLPLCSAAIQAATDPADRADLLLWRGAIHDRQGDLDAALADYAEAEALRPNWADPMVERAYTLFATGDEAGTLAELERARAAEPTSAYAFQESLSLLADLGRPEECLALVPETIALAPDDPYSHASAGRCAHDAGQLDQALAGYTRARELGLDEAFLRNNLALLHILRGDLDAAESEARAAIALDTLWPNPRRTLGDILIEKGDLDGAIAVWDEAKGIVGYEDDALANQVAWYLFLAGRHEEGLRVAEEWFQLAGTAVPPDADRIDTLAHLQAAAGRGEEAVDTFLAAAKAGGLGRRDMYLGRLAALGFNAERGFREALRACVDTRANCRLWEE